MAIMMVPFFALKSEAEAKPKPSILKLEKKKKLYAKRCRLSKKYRKYRRKYRRYCSRLLIVKRKLKSYKFSKVQVKTKTAPIYISQIEDDNSSAADFFRRDKLLMAALRQKQPINTVKEKEEEKVSAPSIFQAFKKEKKHVSIAKRYEGLSARKDRRTLKTVIKVDPIRIPWCAAFANAVLRKAGYEGTGSLMARSFLKYGRKTRRPSEGDIVVFKRGRNRYAGHVGFYMGETIIDGIKYILVLGGNQRKAVNVALYPKRKVLGYRKIA